MRTNKRDFCDEMISSKNVKCKHYDEKPLSVIKMITKITTPLFVVTVCLVLLCNAGNLDLIIGVIVGLALMFAPLYTLITIIRKSVNCEHCGEKPLSVNESIGRAVTPLFSCFFILIALLVLFLNANELNLIGAIIVLAIMFVPLYFLIDFVRGKFWYKNNF